MDATSDAGDPPPSADASSILRSGGGARAASELRVVAQLRSLSVSLNAERSGERLALLAMQELVAEVVLRPGGEMNVSGQLGNLSAQDTFTAPAHPYEMVGLRAGEQSLLTFVYNVPTEAKRAAARAALHCDSSIRVRMSSVQVNYWHPAVMRTVDYLFDGVLGALVSATASTMAQVARSVLIESASGLKDGDAVSKSDPYVVVRLGPAGSTWAVEGSAARAEPSSEPSETARPTAG